MSRRDFLRLYSKNAQDAAERLAKAAVRLSEEEFENAVHVYELAYSRNSWDRKTKRERDLWKKDYDKTLERFIKLLNEAPRPPYDDDHIFGPEMFEILSSKQYLDVMNSPGYTIIDVLLNDQSAQELAAHGATLLKKPRDEDSPRAFFLQLYQEVQPNLSAVQVGQIATEMFGNETNERVVRRFRTRTGS